MRHATGAEVCAAPFRHVRLPNFISDREFVADLITELQSLDMQDKNNDLYKFKQVQVFQEQLLPWLRDVTESPLNDKVDLFCSQYDYTDTLLCHDDELEERHIAFIYYLVPQLWSSEDGGTLDLFDTDDHCQPTDIVKSIVPTQNQFVFFEVSPKSFHQEDVFFNWINPIYLSPEIQADIRERFEAESEIELSDFLKSLGWIVNLEKSDLTPSQDFVHLGVLNAAADLVPFGRLRLRPIQMALLAQWRPATGSLGDPTFGKPLIDLFATRWNCKLPTFISPVPDPPAWACDALASSWENMVGYAYPPTCLGCLDVGQRAQLHLAEVLLSVCPSPNSLALVYREEETMRFVKHINHRATKAKESQYYCVSAIYYEKPE
nr:hypothetical protein BaRGS_003222 [Batillaria attramentaria]